MSTIEGFDQLGLPTALAEHVADLGYEAPTPIQAAAVPAMLAGHDLLCQAATGTGKTAAFALPMIASIAAAGGAEGRATTSPAGLVLAPTRELCIQVSEAVHRYGQPFGIRTLPVYGGQPIGRQIFALKRGADIVVATPGRALDLIQRNILHLEDIRIAVLDEADEMLDMGFAEDLEAILAATPDERQTVMFSATMPKRMRRIAKEHLRDPQRIEIGRDLAAEDEKPTIAQTAYIVSRQHKVAALCRLLDVHTPAAALVFCRTRAEVDQLAETLNARGYRAEGLHGGMDQTQRDRVMGRLRSGGAELLLATDVAARGLDVDHLTHVVNFDVPAAPESYVHRIGRVGRGGRTGTAITIAEPRERRQLAAIERATGQRIQIAPVPSSAELRQLRLAATRAALAELCLSDDLDTFRPIVAELSSEIDPDTVTLAAVKMAHLATAGEEGENEIPAPAEARPGGSRKDGKRGEGKGGPGKRTEGAYAEGKRSSGRSSERAASAPPASGKQRIFINAGADAGLRAKDVVGAIANETDLSGKQIGPISIGARGTTVDVPANAAAEVIGALSRTRVKGRRVKARADRG
ncbi:MAG: DEAD/DEAH box helicase [Candidatus Nanopelagicales bacterium]